jgi:hypothetical protein
MQAPFIFQHTYRITSGLLCAHKEIGNWKWDAERGLSGCSQAIVIEYIIYGT